MYVIGRDVLTAGALAVADITSVTQNPPVVRARGLSLCEVDAGTVRANGSASPCLYEFAISS